MRRIIYTRPDGGVSICCPSQEIMRAMSHGQFWQHMPRGYMDVQIERQMARGVSAYAANRYARALVFGGLTTAEALEVIRDRDCGHLGTAHELWDVDEIPRDRWFRDAWTRSHNGGHINICMRKAKRIQFAKVKSAVERENKRRHADIDLFDRPIDLPWGAIRDRIHAASEPSDLRRIWPEELS